jgi:hypothetical protein
MSFDPLELGYEALIAIGRVRASLPARRMLPDVERVEEIVRRLAWGREGLRVAFGN